MSISSVVSVIAKSVEEYFYGFGIAPDLYLLRFFNFGKVMIICYQNSICI